MPISCSFSGSNYRLVRACLVAIFIVGTSGGMADEKKANLQQTFSALRKTFGLKNPDNATVVSGPLPVKMLRGQSPGKVWQVKLGEVQFKLTIEDKLDLKVEDGLKRLERLPTIYWKAFQIVSEGTKDGVAYYQNLDGAAAHGSQNYLNLVKNADAVVVAHECGHVLEQRVTSRDPHTLDQWKTAIKADNISVSNYGDHVAHEDLAEFSSIYALCLDGGKLEDLKKLSLQRFSQWERILKEAAPVADQLRTP